MLARKLNLSAIMPTPFVAIKQFRRTISKFDSYGNSPIPPSKQKFVPQCGEYPTGFSATGVYSGIKPSAASRPDLVLIASEKPAVGAAVFTKNKFQAAPVTVCKKILKKTTGDGIHGVVINSWCANAVTGKGGLEDAYSLSREAHRVLEGKNESTTQSPSVLVMSTGVIGQRLPMAKILPSLTRAREELGQSHEHWLKAATGICTTDTFPKLVSRSFSLPSTPGITFSIAGISKGAGMIHPNMATLLSVICTDAAVTPIALQSLLSYAVDRSFNSISIDGDTSTNDTVALLANGAAGGPMIDSVEPMKAMSPDYLAFRDVLTDLALDLAKLVVRDGEGATKFVKIRVTGSPSHAAAKKVASTIAKSPLVKTALYGKDANWGRILCAVGYALTDTEFDTQDIVNPDMTTVSFVPVDSSPRLDLLVNGEPENVDEERAGEILQNEDLEILVNLRDGGDGEQGEEAVYWTCDLSHEYVTINGDYRT